MVRARARVRPMCIAYVSWCRTVGADYASIRCCASLPRRHVNASLDNSSSSSRGSGSSSVVVDGSERIGTHGPSSLPPPPPPPVHAHQALSNFFYCLLPLLGTPTQRRQTCASPEGYLQNGSAKCMHVCMRARPRNEPSVAAVCDPRNATQEDSFRGLERTRARIPSFRMSMLWLGFIFFSTLTSTGKLNSLP